MTLKNKFRQAFGLPRITDYGCELMEKIADEFAIGFAEWIRKETYYEHLTKEYFYKRNIYKSEKELLEIYKKEKGL